MTTQAGNLPGPIAKLLGGAQQATSTLDSFINKPGGSLLMNLLAQQGYSTMPQSPLGAIGRASLATQEQDLKRKLLEARMLGSDVAAPSSVREFEFFEGLGPEAQRRYLSVKRAQQLENIPGAGFGSVGAEGEFNPIIGEDTIVGGLTSRAGASEAGKQGAITEAIPGQVAARSEAEALAGLPVDLAGYDASIAQADATIAKVKDLMPLTDEAGLPVVIRGNLPGKFGGDPRRLKQGAQSLKANFAFDTLQKMRAQSKTGGALGQVSERELDLLINALQAIDIEGEPEQLQENLQKVVTHYENYKREIEVMKNAMREQAGQAPVAPSTPQNSAQERIDAL